eukprot:218914_1
MLKHGTKQVNLKDQLMGNNYNTMFKVNQKILCTDTRYKNKTKKYKATIEKIEENRVFVVFKCYSIPISQAVWIPREEWSKRITILKTGKSTTVTINDESINNSQAMQQKQTIHMSTPVDDNPLQFYVGQEIACKNVKLKHPKFFDARIKKVEPHRVLVGWTLSKYTDPKYDQWVQKKYYATRIREPIDSMSNDLKSNDIYDDVNTDGDEYNAHESEKESPNDTDEKCTNDESMIKRDVKRNKDHHLLIEQYISLIRDLYTNSHEMLSKPLAYVVKREDKTVFIETLLKLEMILDEYPVALEPTDDEFYEDGHGVVIEVSGLPDNFNKKCMPDYLNSFDFKMKDIVTQIKHVPKENKCYITSGEFLASLYQAQIPYTSKIIKLDDDTYCNIFGDRRYQQDRLSIINEHKLFDVVLERKAECTVPDEEMAKHMMRFVMYLCRCSPNYKFSHAYKTIYYIWSNLEAKRCHSTMQIYMFPRMYMLPRILMGGRHNEDAAKEILKMQRLIKRNQELEQKTVHLETEVTRLTQILQGQLTEECQNKMDRISLDKDTMRKEVKQKQMRIDNAMDIHVNILKEWNDHLQQEFEKAKNMMQQNDESKQNDHVMPVAELLKSFIKSTDAVRVQQSRVDDIAEHIISVIQSKKELKTLLKNYDSDTTEQKYKELSEQSYTELREQFYEKVTNMNKEINELVKREKNINDNLNKFLVSLVEKEEYEALLTKCKSLATKYHEFETSVDSNMNNLQEIFQQQWDKHEMKWTKWSVDDIICWIKYLIHDNKITLSKSVDLDAVAEQMRIQQFKGKSLSKIEKNDLKLFGIGLFDDYVQIYEQIQLVINKYPNIEDTKEFKCPLSGKIMMDPIVVIPEEFKCPISGKMMMDPIVYDGVTYDRDNFMEYVKKHNPGDEDDIVEWMFTNRKLKQKIDAFLKVNSQFKIKV